MPFQVINDQIMLRPEERKEGFRTRELSRTKRGVLCSGLRREPKRFYLFDSKTGEAISFDIFGVKVNLKVASLFISNESSAFFSSFLLTIAPIFCL